MRWYYAIFTLLLLWGYRGEAQRSAFDRQWWLGVKGGVSLSRYSFQPTVSQQMSLHPLAGLALRYDVERGASLQLEWQYVRTGWTERYDAPELGYRQTFDYVEMPLLTHLYMGKKRLRLYINAGPYIGYRVGESHRIEGDAELFSDIDQLRHAQPLTRKFAWGLTGGPGLSLQLGKSRIELDTRIVYSFVDVLPNKRVDPYGGSSELRFSLGISYFFGL